MAILKSFTVRNRSDDFQIAIKLLQAKISPAQFSHCFTFLLVRGNIQNDYEIVITLINAGIKPENLQNCANYLLARGNIHGDDLHLLCKLAKAVSV